MSTFHVLSTTAIAVGSSIVSITLENTSTYVQENVPFTFGQVFSEGHLPTNGAAVELRAPDNSIVPCQMDVKTTYKDGSVRFAILSAIVPTLAASASIKYDIVRKAVANAGQAPTLAEYPDLSIVMTIKDTGILREGPTAGVVYTADFRAVMAQNKFTTWLSGPICSEWLMRAPLVTADGVVHPDIHVRFNIRVYKGIQKAKIDYIVENNWVKPKAVMSGSNVWENVSILPIIYTYNLAVGGVSVASRNSRAYHSVGLAANSAGAYNGNNTNVPNDDTVYTATMTIDGIPKFISLAGTAIQKFGTLFAAINTQLGGLATCTISDGNGGMKITSNSSGAGSSVVIDGGTLYPILKAYMPLDRAIQGGEYVHNARTRWKRTVWWNTEPSIHIRHDKHYLINSKVVPNYNPLLTGDTAFIDAKWAEIQNNSDIGKNGIQKAGMPAQGGSPGIGILPSWTSVYIVNQGEKAKKTMLLQGDLMGSWPVIFREYDTDEPVNLAKWPMVTRTGSGGDSKNLATGFQELLPNASQPSGIPSSGNTPDVAHHPDMCFVPYLVTGDHYYMESMLFYMMFLLIQQNPAGSYRAGAKGLFHRDQTRGNAWAMRTLAHNLYLLPDNHGHRANLTYVMASNVEWYNNNFVVAGAPLFSMFGRLREILYEGNLAVGQFQEDFYTQAIGRAIELGFEEFLPMLRYRNLNVTGRLTSGTDFCWRQATLYALHIRATNGGPEYTSWADAYKASKPDLVGVACLSPQMDNAIGWGSNSMHGYPDSTEGYPANFQPAVAYCAMFDLPKAKDAWMVLDARSPKADYNKGAQFGIEPRVFLNSTGTGGEPIPTNQLPVDSYSITQGQIMLFGRN